MRSISIRQFQRNFYNEIHDLPFAVKRRNPKDYKATETLCVVIPFKEEESIPSDQSDIPVKNLDDLKMKSINNELPPSTLDDLIKEEPPEIEMLPKITPHPGTEIQVEEMAIEAERNPQTELPDCGGCTDTDPLGGTHSYETKQHGHAPLQQESTLSQRGSFFKRLFNRK